MALPTDSEDDVYDDDSDIDPDYSPIERKENYSYALSEEDEEQVIEENSIQNHPFHTESDSEGDIGEKENFNPNTKKNKQILKRGRRWKANKDNDFSKEPPVFHPEKESNVIGETPLDYFYKLIPESYLQEICFQSNLYATQKGKENLNISVAEMKIFLGINFVMTYVRYARLRQYWSSVGDLRLGIIANHMSINRFEAIKCYLHFQDNSTIPVDNKDRLVRLRPFLNLIHCTFHEARKPEESQSIDEMMVPFKGRSSLKQYIKSKPKPWGFKIWVRSGISGYVYCFEIFQGANGGRIAPSKEYGAAGDVVLRLCHDISGKNHKLYCDNLFTSIPLIEELKRQKIYFVGTIRSNRMLGASEKLKDPKSLLKEGRGSISVTSSEENVTITRWVDSNIVHVASPFAGVQPIDKAKRFSHKTKSFVEIARPNAVKIYNLHMGGVDLMDSLVALYRHSQRNKRWYMRIFFHLMNVTVVNAWLLWRKDGREAKDLLEFKSSIASSLIYTGASLMTKKRGRPSTSNSPSLDASRKKRNLSNVATELRFDDGKHYPKKSDGKFALKCKNETCKSKTRYLCGRCNVYLCPECFEDFHEKYFFFSEMHPLLHTSLI